MKIYSIYDLKSETFGPVFSMNNDVNARRYVEGLVRQEHSVEHDYKSDFVLKCLGSIDETSGVINSDIQIIVSLGSIE